MPPKKLKRGYKKTTLKNGLRVITIPQKETKAVTVLILVATGSKYETKNISGISHFLEHTIFMGSKKFKDFTQVHEQVDEIGASHNAFTGEDYTGFYVTAATEHMERIIDWLTEIFFNATFPSQAVETERGVIISELKMFFDNPRRFIYDFWKILLYGDQPAGWDIAGTIESVSAIKRNEIIAYRDSRYVAKNIVVCVAGNISEKKTLDYVKKRFKNVKTGKPKAKAPVIEKQSEPRAKILFRDMKLANIALGVRTYDMFHPRRYAADLIAIILGGMTSSRLYKAIRVDEGTGYDLQTFNDSDPDTGCLATFVGIDKEKTEKAIITILKEYKKIAEKGVSAKELKKVKDYIKGHMVLGLESSYSKAIYYANQELLRNEILPIEEIMRRINKVTREDIQETAKDIFKPEKLNLAMIGPFKDEQKFKKLLKF
ncbi:MAG: pitrilysin family protein [Candidatus Paceibacterota bacterium]